MRVFIYTLIGLLLLGPAFASAQTFQGGVRGAVRDADGGVLPGTTVTLTNDDTGVARTSVTNERGEYVFASVAPGTYSLSVELAGFAPFRREALEVGVQTFLVQDVTLQVGGIAESVTVTGETPLIETANASIASAIDKAQLEVLPTPGRNVFIMAVTTPNIVHTGDPVFVRQQDQTNSSLLSLGGGPLRGNLYTMDGVAMTDMRNRAVIIPGFEGTEEMKVQINTYDAEMGRTGGAVFNTIHKSGTNSWAGSGLWQSRPNFGRSKTLFETEKVADAPYDLWGGSFGGPIARDKAFFYLSTEGYKNVDLRNDVMTFPSIAMANGDFSAFNRQIYNPFQTDANGNRVPFPNNQIPANLIDPTGQSLARTLAEVGQAGGCPAQISEPCDVGATAALDNIAYQWTANVNTSITDNWQLSGTWMMYDSEEPADKYYTDIVGETLPFDTGAATLFRRAYVLAVNSTHIIGDSDVMTLRYGWTYFDDSTSNPEQTASDIRGLGFTGPWVDQIPIRQFPYITATGYGDPSTGTHGSWSSSDVLWWSQEASGTYSKFVGSHTMKFGGQWRRIGLDATGFGYGFSMNFRQNFTQGPDPRSPASGTGDAIAAMLLGIPSDGESIVPTEANVFADYFGGFVQDDWRLNEDLVLNLGLRLEYETGLNEKNNAFITEWGYDTPYPVQVSAPGALGNAPGFPLTGGPLYAGVGGAKTTQWDPPAIKLGPRAGFAYSLDEATVIRGGFGVYWAPYTIPSGTSVSHLGTEGYTASTEYAGSTDGVNPIGTPGGPGSLTNPWPNGVNTPVGNSLGQLTSAGGAITINDQFKKSPYITKWSFDYQRDLGRNVALKVGYVGSRGSNLGVGGTNNSTVNINQLDPTFLSLGSSLDDQIANPFFGNSAFGSLANSETLPRGQLLRPFPQYTDVFARHVSDARSTYNALRLELEKRFRGNWGARINYTYSQQRDNIYESNTLLEDEESVVFINSLLDDDFGPSRINSPHWLNLNGLYRFPSPDGGVAEAIAGGWSASVSALFRAGFPLAIKQDTNNLGSRYGFDHQRPNLTGADLAGTADLGGISHGDTPGSLTGLINPDAFTNADAFTPGNTPQTIDDVRTPKLVNWDVSFDKTTSLGGDANLILRFEFINIFNGINWRGPRSVYGVSNFGQTPGVRGFPRTMQFMAKITF
jgi:hypothetical protein